MKKKHDDTPHNRLFLLTYDYGESGRTQRCGFLCEAASLREAAELFWNQHPAEWFSLQRVTDGNFEAFWHKESGQFVTIPPDREQEGGGMTRAFLLEHEALRCLAEGQLLRFHPRVPRGRARGKEKLK